MKFVFILIGIGFFLEIYQLFGLGTTGFTVCDAANVLLFIIFLKRAFWDGEEFLIAKNPAIFFLIWFYLAIIFSGIAPIFSGQKGYITQFIKSNAHFHFTLLFLTLNILMNNNSKTWDYLIKTWLISSLFINIFGIYQIFARAFNLPLAWLEIGNVSYTSRGMYDNLEDVSQLSIQFENFFRSTSIFSEPSALASFNAIILVFLIIPYVQKQPAYIKNKILYFLIFFFCVVGLFSAFSLTGLSSFVILILSILLFEKIKNLSFFFKIFIIIVAVLVIADQIISIYTDISIFYLFFKRLSGIFDFILTNQLSDLEGESFSGRTDNIQAMLTIFRHSPIYGIGLGLTYTSPYADGWLFADITLMAVLAETGIIGFIGFFGYFITLLIISAKILIYRNSINIKDISFNRLLLMLFYILNVYFVVNYLSGNQIVNYFSVILLAIVFTTINQYYIVQLNRFYKLKLIKVPIKLAIKTFLESKNEIKTI